MDDHTQMVLPWLGGAHVYGYGRAWKCRKTPRHPGWYAFQNSPSRYTTLASPEETSANLDALEGFPTQKGYLVADRFIALNAPIRAGVSLLHQTRPVFCLEPGSDWLQPAVVAEDPQGRLIFTRKLWFKEQDRAVIEAFHDRAPSLAGIRHVTPALDLAFQWATQERLQGEQQRAAQEALIARDRLLAEAIRTGQTAVGRRLIAEADFDQAATLALQQGDAVFLSSHSIGRGERIVRYRCVGLRLECVVDAATLGVLDAGVCLTADGIRGDSLFTLESLPGVIREASNEGALVILRH